MRLRLIFILNLILSILSSGILGTHLLSAGDVTQIGFIETYNGGIILSTDPAGLTYNGTHLFITDSEINETGPPPPPGYFRGYNIFEVNLTGTTVYGEYVTTPASGKLEPTGICFNPVDGYFYITNDLSRTLYQYEFNGNFSLLDSWNLREAPFDQLGFGIEDPEGIGIDPNTGRMYIADGSGGYLGGRNIIAVEVRQSSIFRITSFSVADRMEDPEGIAFHENTGHLFIISNPNRMIFEYDVSGRYIDEYDVSRLQPIPRSLSGLTFAPNSNDNSRVSLYIADRGLDASPDRAGIYEVELDIYSPVVANPIPDQHTIVDVAYNYTFPDNTFMDKYGRDNLKYTAILSDNSALPDWLSFSSSKCRFSGTPHSADLGIISIKVTATDRSAGSVSDEFDLAVMPENTPPVITSVPDVYFNEDDSLILHISSFYEFVEDPDTPASDLSFAFVPGEQVFVYMDGAEVIFTAPSDWYGTDIVSMTVTDITSSDTAEMVVTVLPINDAPVFINLPDTVEYTLSAGAVITMNDYVEDKDLPNDSLRWQFEVSDNTVIFEFNHENSELTLASTEFVGMVTFYCMVMDDSSATDSDSFVIKVTPDPMAISDFVNQIPHNYALIQNYPNPFNPFTFIRFELPKSTEVKMVVYNLLGQKVLTLIDQVKAAGYHVVRVDAGHLSSGIYLYQIQTNEFTDIKKMIVIK